jgi:hypothetical protein
MQNLEPNGRQAPRCDRKVPWNTVASQRVREIRFELR